MRRITIEDLSKKGLLLRGSAALYLNVAIGDRLLVYTTFGEERVCLEGVVTRSTPGVEQLIGLRDVKWFEGWPSALSAEERAAEGPGDSVSPDESSDALTLSVPES